MHSYFLLHQQYYLYSKMATNGTQIIIENTHYKEVEKVLVLQRITKYMVENFHHQQRKCIKNKEECQFLYIPFLYTACSLKLLLSTIERGSNEPGVNFFLLSMTTYKTMRFKKFTVHLKARQFRGAMPIPSDSLFRLKPAAFI